MRRSVLSLTMVRRVTRVMSTRPFLLYLCQACVLLLSSDLPEWLVLSCYVLSVGLNYQLCSRVVYNT